MKFFIIDDDKAVINILELIIQNNDIGEISGNASNGIDALEELRYVTANIVLVDLLMPDMDGITFVRRAKEQFQGQMYIMISHVTQKEMIVQAYKSGIDFFINKPINSIEVLAVIEKAQRLFYMESTFQQMQTLLQSSVFGKAHPSAAKIQTAQEQKLNLILQRLGISGNPACKEITQIVLYLLAHDFDKLQMNISEICGLFSKSPKAVEQRIRRAVTCGMVNLANMGIEDYSNEVFTEYAGVLYRFEQVRNEMNYIRRKSNIHGSVSVRHFLYSLASICKNI